MVGSVSSPLDAVIRKLGWHVLQILYILCFVGISQIDRAGFEKAPRWVKIWSKSFKTKTCLDFVILCLSLSLYIYIYKTKVTLKIHMCFVLINSVLLNLFEYNWINCMHDLSEYVSNYMI